MTKKLWALPRRLVKHAFPVAKTDIYSLPDGTKYLAVFDNPSILQRWVAFEFRIGKRGDYNLYRIGNTAEGQRAFSDELTHNKVVARRILDITKSGAITSEPYEVQQ
jgi:hypothetical protein